MMPVSVVNISEHMYVRVALRKRTGNHLAPHAVARCQIFEGAENISVMLAFSLKGLFYEYSQG